MNLSVEVPFPGAAIEVGLKVAVTPDGMPVAVKAIAELKPLGIVVVTVVVTELLLPTLTGLGDALMPKLGAATVRLTEVELVMGPLGPVAVPVMLIG